MFQGNSSWCVRVMYLMCSPIKAGKKTALLIILSSGGYFCSSCQTGCSVDVHKGVKVSFDFLFLKVTICQHWRLRHRCRQSHQQIVGFYGLTFFFFLNNSVTLSSLQGFNDKQQRMDIQSVTYVSDKSSVPDKSRINKPSSAAAGVAHLLIVFMYFEVQLQVSRELTVPTFSWGTFKSHD